MGHLPMYSKNRVFVIVYYYMYSTCHRMEKILVSQVSTQNIYCYKYIWIVTSLNSEFLFACTTNAYIQRLHTDIIESVKVTVDSVAAMKDHQRGWMVKIHNTTGDLSSEVESQKAEEIVCPKEWEKLKLQ